MSNVTDNGQPDETQDEEFPVCPGCGERHPPASNEVQMVFNFVMSRLVTQLGNDDALSVMCSATVALLEKLPIRTRITILAKLGFAAGITPDVLAALETAPPQDIPARIRGVDLSRFTPRGKAN